MKPIAHEVLQVDKTNLGHQVVASSLHHLLRDPNHHPTPLQTTHWTYAKECWALESEDLVVVFSVTFHIHLVTQWLLGSEGIGG